MTADAAAHGAGGQRCLLVVGNVADPHHATVEPVDRVAGSRPGDHSVGLVGQQLHGEQVEVPPQRGRHAQAADRPVDHPGRCRAQRAERVQGALRTGGEERRAATVGGEGRQTIGTAAPDKPGVPAVIEVLGQQRVHQPALQPQPLQQPPHVGDRRQRVDRLAGHALGLLGHQRRPVVDVGQHHRSGRRPRQLQRSAHPRPQPKLQVDLEAQPRRQQLACPGLGGVGPHRAHHRVSQQVGRHQREHLPGGGGLVEQRLAQLGQRHLAVLDQRPAHQRPQVEAVRATTEERGPVGGVLHRVGKGQQLPLLALQVVGAKQRVDRHRRQAGHPQPQKPNGVAFLATRAAAGPGVVLAVGHQHGQSVLGSGVAQRVVDG